RADDDHAVLSGQAAQALGAGTGNRLGQVELAHVLALAEVGAVVQFLQQHQLRVLARGFRHALLNDREVGIGVAMVALLDERDGKDLLHPAIVGGRASTTCLAAAAWSGSAGCRSARSGRGTAPARSRGRETPRAAR